MNIVADRHIPAVATALAHIGRVTRLDPGAIDRRCLRDCDVLLVRTVTPVNADLLEGTPVKFVGTATSGTDHVDSDYLAEAGIGFAHAAGSNARPVAEYVLSALAAAGEQRGGRLADLSVAVVGCGHVGGLLTDLLAGLGVRCLRHDPPLAATLAQGRQEDFCDLDTALTADVVSLHVPLSRGGEYPTWHLLDAARLAQLRPGAVVINTARGGVVDEAALTAALREQHLQAVIDVWEDEPAINVELAALATFATPHIAGYSLEAKLRATDCLRSALEAYFAIAPAAPVSSGLPVCTSLTLAGDDVDEMTRLAVLASYDVRSDALVLPQFGTLATGCRPGCFTGLRHDYCLRREFPSVGLRLEGAMVAQAFDLRRLGFTIINAPPD